MQTRFRKTLLLVGGSGEMGQKICSRFTQTYFKKWHVINVDHEENPQATHNFKVDLRDGNPFAQEELLQ